MSDIDLQREVTQIIYDSFKTNCSPAHSLTVAQIQARLTTEVSDAVLIDNLHSLVTNHVLIHYPNTYLKNQDATYGLNQSLFTDRPQNLQLLGCET